MKTAQNESRNCLRSTASDRSGGQGIRTLNPLRGTHFPSGLLAIRIPSFFGLRHFEW